MRGPVLRGWPIVFSVSTLLFQLSMIVVGGIGTVWCLRLGVALLVLADDGIAEAGAKSARSCPGLVCDFLILRIGWPFRRDIWNKIRFLV